MLKATAPGTVFPPRLFGEKTMRTIMCKTWQTESLFSASNRTPQLSDTINQTLNRPRVRPWRGPSVHVRLMHGLLTYQYDW